MTFEQLSEQTTEQNYKLICSRVKKAHDRFDTDTSLPTIIAVSKTQSSEKIEQLLDLNHRVFGENRVQEALGKWPDLIEKYPDVELHLIGPLQTNKVKDALKIFNTIQSLDREKLAKALAQEIEKTKKNINCFVQINLGQEEQKAGIEPESALDFVKNCREEYGLNIIGLMCIPPFGEAAGPYFAQLKLLAEQVEVKNLSMGMSADFETAIEMGATHVRVGTALFGTRSLPLAK
ncbi:MAG: YggS family pyridoxal phosphate-dependent enzyme [Devosiaceae bacterium]|nr:YggS family pyridoxal phosphate-dependent enzyme [Devosiaceae bacterium]